MRVFTNTRGLIVVFLLGLIIGLGIGVLVPQGSDVLIEEESAQEESMVKEDSLPTVASGENLLVVNSQSAGDSVIASMISLETSGWVAIHEVVGGELGVILGAKRFSEGKHFGERIELLRATEAEKTYTLVLHADDGDSEFDFTKEVPVTDTQGNLISEEFFVTPAIPQ